jgi:hypothetical protein
VSATNDVERGGLRQEAVSLRRGAPYHGCRDAACASTVGKRRNPRILTAQAYAIASVLVSVRDARRRPHLHGLTTPWNVSQRPSRFGLTSRPLLAHRTPTGCASVTGVPRAGLEPLGRPRPRRRRGRRPSPRRQRHPLRAPAAHGHRLHNNPPGRVCPSCAR